MRSRVYQVILLLYLAKEHKETESGSLIDQLYFHSSQSIYKRDLFEFGFKEDILLNINSFFSKTETRNYVSSVKEVHGDKLLVSLEDGGYLLPNNGGAIEKIINSKYQFLQMSQDKKSCHYFLTDSKRAIIRDLVRFEHQPLWIFDFSQIEGEACGLAYDKKYGRMYLLSTSGEFVMKEKSGLTFTRYLSDEIVQEDELVFHSFAFNKEFRLCAVSCSTKKFNYMISIKVREKGISVENVHQERRSAQLGNQSINSSRRILSAKLFVEGKQLPNLTRSVQAKEHPQRVYQRQRQLRI